MQANTIRQFVLSIFIMTALVACGSSGGSNSSVDTTGNQQTTDSAPTVNAGMDQSVNAGEQVTLTATVTDDGSYTVSWVQTSGTTVELSASDNESTSFTAPEVTNSELLSFTISVDDGVNAAVSDSVNVTILAPSTPQSDSVWLINTDGQRAAHILEPDSSLGVLVNVQSVLEEVVDGVDYTVVTSNGIPDYSVEITQDIYEFLQSRPLASRDFVTGTALVNVGEVVEFGSDIGYASNGDCETNAGYGYWPPGPVCPEQDTREAYLPKEPLATSEECSTGLGKVGLWVNGSSIYNWGDGQSYDNQGVWQNLAPVAEQYDVDICGGHAANGDYHHHFYSSCLADMVGDTANGHSPLYGYASDGFPVYGPWEAEGVLAVSSWVVRDYSADSATGCSDGQRSCGLVDPYNVSLGTESVSAGPDLDTVVTTLSGNELSAYNGYYREDYYWDSSLTEQGGEYLDQYNAHYDDDRGYHYHTTVTQIDGKLVPAYPYVVGDRYAGELQDNALSFCSTGNTGPGGPGGGPGG